MTSADQKYHDSWECTRTLDTISYKKRIFPRQLILLPWDDKSHKPHSTKLTLEERRTRFEQIAKKCHVRILKPIIEFRLPFIGIG